MLAPPTAPPTKPELSGKTGNLLSSKSLFGVKNSSKTSFFRAFEGLLKEFGVPNSGDKKTLRLETPLLPKTKNAKDTRNPLAEKTTQTSVPKKNKSADREKLLSVFSSGQNLVPVPVKESGMVPKGQAQSQKTVAEEKESKETAPKKLTNDIKASGAGKKSLELDQNSQIAAQVTESAFQQKKAVPMDEQNRSSKLEADTNGGKSRNRRKERIDIEVYDLRTQKTDQRPKQGEASSLQDSSNKTVEVTLHLKEEASQKSGGADTSTSLGPSRSFQDLLAQELHNSINGDIVRHASMVLKDGGEGLIKLNLKPESLGNVRIKLEMADNKVTGHILVDTQEALKAFEKEIQSLEQAFRDGGFQGASLEVSVSSEGQGSGSWPQGEGQQQPFYSERLAAGFYDEASPGLEALSDDISNRNQNSPSSSGTNVSINMLA